MFEMFKKKKPSEVKYQQNELWTMKDKTQIRVSDMSEQHVRNVLNMILRHRRQAMEEAALEFSVFNDEEF